MSVNPGSVRLEAAAICQLKCPTCPTGTGANAPVLGRGYLRAEAFRGFLRSNPKVRHIELSNFGEIFLNPDLPEIFRLAHENGVALTAGNGVNLNRAAPEALEALVKFQVRQMTVAIDGASPETYAIYRQNGHFEDVIGNVRTINGHKKAAGSRYPELTWQFVVFGHNEHEIGKARAMAEELGMEFRPKMNWDDVYSPIKDAAAVKRMTGWEEVARGAYEARTGRPYLGRICHQLWDSPQFNWDGKVLGCCVNDWGEFGGNVFQQGVKACANGENISHARAMLLGRAPPRPGIPCTTCNRYLVMRSTGNFLRRPGPLRLLRYWAQTRWRRLRGD